MGAIHRLAGRGDPFKLLAALEAGADPNDSSGREGRRPLMDAAKGDHRVAARLLLKFGASVDSADDSGRTALIDAASREMRRLLLEAGANPDLGRLGGMTLTAFLTCFRQRETVDLLLSYGADPKERVRKGRTVQEILDDPTSTWSSSDPLNTPERQAKHADKILEFSDGLRISPEQYVCKHRNIIIWGYGRYDYDDPRLKGWAQGVSNLLASPELTEVAYRAHLRGEDLLTALRSLERPKRRAEKERLWLQRIAEFEALYFPAG